MYQVQGEGTGEVGLTFRTVSKNQWPTKFTHFSPYLITIHTKYSERYVSSKSQPGILYTMTGYENHFFSFCLWGKVGKGAKPSLIIGGGKSPLLQLHPKLIFAVLGLVGKGSFSPSHYVSPRGATATRGLLFKSRRWTDPPRTPPGKWTAEIPRAKALGTT